MYPLSNARLIQRKIEKSDESKPFNLRDEVKHFQTDSRVGVQKLSQKQLKSKMDDVDIIKDSDLKYYIYFTDKYDQRYGINLLMRDLHQLPQSECKMCQDQNSSKVCPSKLHCLLESYDGEWSNDLRHGYGDAKSYSGYNYSGLYHKGFKNGQGTLSYQGRKISEGLWINGHSFKNLEKYLVRQVESKIRAQQVGQMLMQSILMVDVSVENTIQVNVRKHEALRATHDS